VVGDHDDLEAELAHGVGRLFDRFLGRVDGHHRGRRDPIAIGREHLGVHEVHRARDAAADLLVGVVDVEEAE